MRFVQKASINVDLISMYVYKIDAPNLVAFPHLEVVDIAAVLCYAVQLCSAQELSYLIFF